MKKKSAAGSGMRFLLWTCACLMVLACASLGRAQALADAPVLISDANSTRALAVNPGNSRSGRLPASTQVAWPASNETLVTVFATNLDLLPDEGATAFRADATTAQGRRYSLAVESISPLVNYGWIYAVTIRLNGDLGNAGDVLLRLNWRGMASNRVRLSVGYIGGGPKDDDGAVPTPAPLSMPEEPATNMERIARPFDPDNMRLLEQATFGPTYASELRLRRIGIQRWIEEQLAQRYNGPNAIYSTFPYPATELSPTVPTACDATCLREKYSQYKLQNWFYQEAIYGEDQQLRRRVAWALHQIIVVSGRDTQQPSHMLPYIQVIDRNAFGSFRSLLKEMTLNPAMGNYLDSIRSTQANPNENYAREILQLFSIGLDVLKRDGTPRLDPQGNRIPTYDQNTILGFTKVFTGLNLCNSAPPVCPASIAGRLNFIDDMRFNPADHDTGQKVLLAYPNHPAFVVPAGQTPAEDLRLAIDNIFLHPNVPPFISKLLIQHLVTSNPTPAYVDRVARVFEADSLGERGNLASVVKAILLDPEARGNIKTDPDYGYLREPVLFTTNLMRAFDARSANRTAISDGVINGITIGLDQDVWNPPSVFNYYPPDYLAPNSNILGPEYAIMTTGTSLKRPNFINQMVFQAQGIPANPNGGIPSGTSITMERLQPLAAADLTGAQLVDTLNSLMMHGSMSAAMRNSIMQAVQAVPSADSLKRARTAVYLVATSSQYQVQR